MALSVEDGVGILPVGPGLETKDVHGTDILHASVFSRNRLLFFRIKLIFMY